MGWITQHELEGPNWLGLQRLHLKLLCMHLPNLGKEFALPILMDCQTWYIVICRVLCDHELSVNNKLQLLHYTSCFNFLNNIVLLSLFTNAYCFQWEKGWGRAFLSCGSCKNTFLSKWLLIPARLSTTALNQVLCLTLIWLHLTSPED